MTNLTGGPVELGAPAMTINPPPAKPQEQPETKKEETGDAEKESQDRNDTSR